MADEQHELRQVNWAQVFSFTHIFKSFKMAIHPSKLALALTAIVTIFCLGWAMDQFWALAGQYVQKGEIYSFFVKPSSQFAKDKTAWVEGRLDQAAKLLVETEGEKSYLRSYISKLPAGHLKTAFVNELDRKNKALQEGGVKSPQRSPEDVKKNGDHQSLLGEARGLLGDEMGRIDEVLPDARKAAGGLIDEELKNIAESKKRQDAEERLKKQLKEDLQLAAGSITKRKIEFARKLQEISGEKIFASLLDYQQQCLSNAIAAVRYGDILGGLQDYRDKVRDRGVPPIALSVGQAESIVVEPPTSDRPGFIYWGLLAANGMRWFICQHWVYATVFLVVCLAVIALLGGAIHRIAALHFAREEKISIMQALRFSFGKFLSFFTAPLIPAAGILAVGVVFLAGGGLLLGSLLGLVPLVGNLLLGLLFFLAIIVGLVIAFGLIGLVAGLPLMYPTIAVEGSDSFDAMSRSFSYVLTRPWRAGLYGLVALVYGVICYLFVRLFVFLALASTHYFVKWGVIGYGDRLHIEADKLDVLWQAPTFENLFGPFNWEAMTGSMPIGAWLIGLWVFLAAAGVLAFLLSYAASSATVIYYLLRRKVDATDLDDVYIEEAPEEEALSAEAQAAEEAKEAPGKEEEESAETDQGPQEPLGQ